MILDFSEIFYSRKANIEGLYSNDRDDTVNVWYNISDLHYTELTPLVKVWQNKPLALISYCTVLCSECCFDLSLLSLLMDYKYVSIVSIDAIVLLPDWDHYGNMFLTFSV